mgnify:FL=1
MIDLSPRDQHGLTPFHYACKNGQLYIVSDFIEINEVTFGVKIQMRHFLVIINSVTHQRTFLSSSVSSIKN